MIFKKYLQNFVIIIFNCRTLLLPQKDSITQSKGKLKEKKKIRKEKNMKERVRNNEEKKGKKEEFQIE